MSNETTSNKEVTHGAPGESPDRGETASGATRGTVASGSFADVPSDGRGVDVGANAAAHGDEHVERDGVERHASTEARCAAGECQPAYCPCHCHGVGGTRRMHVDGIDMGAVTSINVGGRIFELLPPKAPRACMACGSTRDLLLTRPLCRDGAKCNSRDADTWAPGMWRREIDGKEPLFCGIEECDQTPTAGSEMCAAHTEPTSACRRCSECRGQAHHWIEDGGLDDDGRIRPDFCCKHCDATVDMCDACDAPDEPGHVCDDDDDDGRRAPDWNVGDDEDNGFCATGPWRATREEAQLDVDRAKQAEAAAAGHGSSAPKERP